MNAPHSRHSRWIVRSVAAIAAGLVLLLPLAGCKRERLLDTDSSFALAVGEYHSLEPQLSVGFQRVVQDSRCPTSVTCVWQGEGIVRLAVVPAHADTSFLELSTQGAHQQGEALGYRFRVDKLEPYPKESQPIPAGDYRVVLSAQRLE